MNAPGLSAVAGVEVVFLFSLPGSVQYAFVHVWNGNADVLRLVPRCLPVSRPFRNCKQLNARFRSAVFLLVLVVSTFPAAGSPTNRKDWFNYVFLRLEGNVRFKATTHDVEICLLCRVTKHIFRGCTQHRTKFFFVFFVFECFCVVRLFYVVGNYGAPYMALSARPLFLFVILCFSVYDGSFCCRSKR